MSKQQTNAAVIREREAYNARLKELRAYVGRPSQKRRKELFRIAATYPLTEAQKLSHALIEVRGCDAVSEALFGGEKGRVG